MNILHTESSCGWGGQEMRILGEMAGMRARGHAVHLLCPPAAKIFSAAQARGIPVTAMPIEKKRLRGVAALRGWLRGHPCEVINTHSSTDSWLTALACATLANAPPIVRTRHISAPVPANAATRWLYTRATARVVTTGEALKLQLTRDNGFPEDSIVSAPTGIDLNHFVPVADAAARRAVRVRLGLPPDAYIVGIVATLRSWKGHRFLVEAMAGIRDAKLLIVGDGPQRAALEALIAQFLPGGRAIMAGQQADVLPWLHTLDAFALPSYANEGVPQAILQAFACALPVVTTAAGAIGEVAGHEDTALIVPMQDSHSLARALERLRADPELARSLGVRALKRAHERHGEGAMLDAMEAVFRATIAARHETGA